MVRWHMQKGDCGDALSTIAYMRCSPMASVVLTRERGFN